jgi:hypothetical protein
LNGAQKKALIAALMSAYPDYGELDYMLDTEVNRKLANYTRPARLPIVVHELIKYAEAEGWTDQLVTGARMGSPGNPELKELLESGFLNRTTAVRRALDDPTGEGVQALLPAAAILDGERTRLERVVKSAVGFRDVPVFASALMEQAARVCSIRVVSATRRSAGTGFLVGPDLVLTNHHVVRDMIDGVASPTGIECVFDYRVTPQRTVDHGIRYPLADDWLVASSPPSAVDEQADPVGLPGDDELDYALIRLNGQPGRATDAGGRERGWIDLLAEPPALADGVPLLILQHPWGHPIKLAEDTEGVRGVNANRTRVSYGVNTLPGSSGSPCFTYDLKLVALHHAEGTTHTGNEGIPIATIAAHLRATPHAALLGG